MLVGETRLALTRAGLATIQASYMTEVNVTISISLQIFTTPV